MRSKEDIKPKEDDNIKKDIADNKKESTSSSGTSTQQPQLSALQNNPSATCDPTKETCPVDNTFGNKRCEDGTHISPAGV